MKRIRQLCLHRIEAYGTNDTMRIDSIRGERIPFSQNTHPKSISRGTSRSPPFPRVPAQHTFHSTRNGKPD